VQNTNILFPVVIYGARAVVTYPNLLGSRPTLLTARCQGEFLGITFLPPNLFGLIGPTPCTFSGSVSISQGSRLDSQVQYTPDNLDWASVSDQTTTLDWDSATVGQSVNQCALVFDGWVSGGNRLTPTSIVSGSPWGSSNSATQLCRSQARTFTAVFGPLSKRRRSLMAVGSSSDSGALVSEGGRGRALSQANLCGQYSAQYTVTVDPQGPAPTTSSATAISISVVNCQTNPIPNLAISNVGASAQGELTRVWKLRRSANSSKQVCRTCLAK